MKQKRQEEKEGGKGSKSVKEECKKKVSLGNKVKQKG